MPSLIKLYLLPGLSLFAFLLASCSNEIQQTPAEATPLSANNISTAPTDLSHATHIPLTWSSLNLSGKLVYPSSTTDGTTLAGTIQMLDLQTGEIATLFSMPKAWVYYSTISPDHKWSVISYAPPEENNSPSNRALYILSLESAKPPQPLFTPPTPDDHYTQAEWSPDGKYIYYVHYNHNNSGGQPNEVYEIFRMTYPNGSPQKILDRAFWPRISSDSSRLVYVSLDPASGKNELFVANADGSNAQQVPLSGSQVPDIIDAPIFSPDGQTILFSAPSPGQSYQPNWFDRVMGIRMAHAHNIPSDWWSVPVQGGVPLQLTKLQTINLFASLSPDKTHLASLSGDGIFVMNLDGSNLTQLISDPGVHGTVSWIP